LRRILVVPLQRMFWLYVLLSFPLVDYIFRRFLPLPLLPSLWDELVLLLLILSAGAFSLVSVREESPSLKPLLALLALGAAYLVVDLAALGPTVDGLRVTFQYMAAYFVGLYLVRSEDELRRITIVLVVVAAIVALGGLLQVVMGVETPDQWVDVSEAVQTRIFSLVQSPNVLGGHMAMAAFLAAGLALSSRDIRRRLVWGGVALLLVGTLLLTFSRGAWLAFLLGGCFLCYFLERRLLVVGLVAVLILAVAIAPVRDRFTSLFNPEYMAKSMSDGRLGRWIRAYDVLRENPLFGLGPGQYGGATAARYFRASYVDNYYVKTMAEMGLVGLAVFLWWLATILLGCYRAWRASHGSREGLLLAGLFGALLVLSLQNGVENIFEVPYLTCYFWFLAGALIAYPSLRGQRGTPEGERV